MTATPPAPNVSEPVDASRWRRRLFAASAAVQAIGLAVYTYSVLWIDNAVQAPHVLRGTDSVIFARAAELWPWDSYAAKVAPLYPLLMNAVFRNQTALVIVQTVLWGLAWHWLARATARLMTHPATEVLSVVVIVGLSLAAPLLLWTAAVMSEALSIMLIAATFACALTAVQRREQRWWVATAAMVALCTLGRDTNAILAVLVVGVALIIAIRSRNARRAALVSIALALSSILVSNVLSSRADPPRWFYPLQENIVLRVTPHPDFLRWFEAKGMPNGKELSELAPSYFLSFPRIENEARFAPFRAWLRDNGPSVYGEFVLSHAHWQFMDFIQGREDMLVSDHREFAEFRGAEPALAYDAVGYATYFQSANGMIVWAAVMLLLLALPFVGWRREDRVLRTVLIAVVVTAGLHALIAFAADALEITRHTVSATAQLRMGVWVASLVLIDRWVARRSTNPQHTTASAPMEQSSIS